MVTFSFKNNELFFLMDLILDLKIEKLRIFRISETVLNKLVDKLDNAERKIYLKRFYDCYKQFEDIAKKEK